MPVVEDAAEARRIAAGRDIGPIPKDEITQKVERSIMARQCRSSAGSTLPVARSIGSGCRAVISPNELT